MRVVLSCVSVTEDDASQDHGLEADDPERAFPQHAVDAPDAFLVGLVHLLALRRTSILVLHDRAVALGADLLVALDPVDGLACHVLSLVGRATAVFSHCPRPPQPPRAAAAP